jgi:hypothetical protein
VARAYGALTIDAVVVAASLPGVTAATHVRSEKALVQGAEHDVSGIAPAVIERFYHFKWATGSTRAIARLGADGALVTKRFAESNHVALGAKLAVTTPAGQHGALVVRGIYDPPASAACCARSA